MNYIARSYQKRMTDLIIDSKLGAEFAEMGLGKTVAVLTAIRELMYDRLEVRRVLILAPLRVATVTWPDEIEKWSHTRGLSYTVIYDDGLASSTPKEELLAQDTDIHIMSYSTLPWLVEHIRGLKKFPLNYDMIVFDESTFVKNVNSKRGKICRGLLYDIPRRVILTGTPSPNGYHDLWGQIYMLDSGARLGTSQTRFQEEHFMRSADGKRLVPMRTSRSKITKKIADIAIALRKQDYLSLPPMIVNPVECHMKAKELEYYKNFENDFMDRLDEAAGAQAFNTAALGMKLRQIVQGFIIKEDQTIQDLNNVKLDAVKEIVDSANTGENFLIAVQFKHDIARLQKRFGDVPAIYSATSVKKSMEYIKAWNRGEIPMLLCHPESVAHGLNLQTGGSNIIWYALPWRQDIFAQFNDRLHRSGQTKPVVLNIPIIRGTMDTVIARALRAKDFTQRKLMIAIHEYRKTQLN